VRVKPKTIRTADVRKRIRYTTTTVLCWSDKFSALFEPHHVWQTYTHFL